MDREEARNRIRERWEVWIRRPKAEQQARAGEYSGLIMLDFYPHIQKERPDLLNFDFPGDKWQIVHAWLLEFDRQRSKHPSS
jgi:hypothetical protein